MVDVKVDKAFLGVANYSEVVWGSKIIQDFLNLYIFFFFLPLQALYRQS